jgi:hypothetical protein
MLGKNNNETIDKLFQSNKGFLEAQSKRGAVPKEATGYAPIQLPEPVAAKLGDLSNDPAMKLVQKIAHENGYTDKEFGVIGKFIEAFDKAGLITDASEFDPKKQFEALSTDHKGITDKRELEVAVGKRVTNVKASLDGLLAKNVIDKGDHENLMALFPVASSFRTLEKVLAKFGGEGGIQVPNDGGHAAGEVTEAEIDKRMLDPRYDTSHPKYEKAFRTETDEMLRKFSAKKR